MRDRQDFFADLQRQKEEQRAARVASEQRETERETCWLQSEEQSRQAEQHRFNTQHEREERTRKRAAEATRKDAEKVEKERVESFTKEQKRLSDFQVWQRWGNSSEIRSERRCQAGLRFSRQG